MWLKKMCDGDITKSICIPMCKDLSQFNVCEPSKLHTKIFIYSWRAWMCSKDQVISRSHACSQQEHGDRPIFPLLYFISFQF
jgi:hypothetical protein